MQNKIIEMSITDGHDEVKFNSVLPELSREELIRLATEAVNQFIFLKESLAVRTKQRITAE